jgi:hypothetical protein
MMSVVGLGRTKSEAKEKRWKTRENRTVMPWIKKRIKIFFCLWRENVNDK